MLKKTNGITLIALIITIIVLLILAGVVVKLSLGENGILGMTKNSVDKYNQTAKNEQLQLGKYENDIDKYVNSTRLTEPNEEFSVTSQYTISYQYCYYVPATRQVHIYVKITDFNENINNDNVTSVLAVVPEKYRPNKLIEGLGGLLYANDFHPCQPTVDPTGKCMCKWTYNVASSAFISIDYII